MADEDFEIDVYGDTEANDAEVDDTKPDSSNNHAYDSNSSITIANGSNPDSAHPHNNDSEDYNQDQRNMGYPSNGATPSQSHQQGIKRKEGSDDRPIDPGATSALLLSELQWWTTDDDIRNWIRRASCEDELKDITFSEHKVNGKSKGQTYVEFTSQQAATAVKREIEMVTSESTQPGLKKITLIYTSPTNNPFKTLPKDAPARANKEGGGRGGSNVGGYNDRGNYRGRGGFNGPRGGFNRNFNNNNNMGGGGGGFHGNVPGGGFNNNMGGGNFGFNNMGGGGGNFGFRGGMMAGGGGMGGGMRGGMRGGRGGGGGMNPGMNPGGMMGGMGMGMPNMMGFQQPAHFNQGFFGGGNQQQSDWQNPHGAKRPREN
ncbi:hypothetical protein GGR53DRAFT_464077 [Hypoxylon sp. FL1150]|nr:hypothetical protein GGR53DRAFT_464077 [Hypoxylon sp. FL1150]